MASEIKGPEPIADRIIAVLRADMPAKLTALDALFRDVPLTPVQAYYIGDSDGKYTWPCVAVSEADPEDMAVTSGGRYLTYPFEIAVLSVDDGMGYERLMRSLWRYQRAVAEILHDHKYEAGYWLDIARIEPLARGPFPLEEGPGAALIKGVRAWFTSTETFS